MMNRRKIANVVMMTLAAMYCIPLTGCTPIGSEDISTFICELVLQATAAFLL